tara:strand:- start:1676 stop:1876 length:201 start_codon:yes stop_codon:yes gene_type:complete
MIDALVCPICNDDRDKVLDCDACNRWGIVKSASGRLGSDKITVVPFEFWEIIARDLDVSAFRSEFE